MQSLTHIHFSTKVPRTGVPIAAIQSREVLSTDAIAVIDTSTTLTQNSFFRQDTLIQLEDKILTYYVDKRGFIITDRFKDGYPLYFKHMLQHPIFTSTDGSADISIADADGTQVDSSFYKFDCSTSTVFHRLDLSNQVYFIIYPKVDASNNIIDTGFKELLHGSPALEEATALNIDNYGLDADADAYTLEEQDGNPYFWRITLPRATKYSLRYTADGLLRIKVPEVSQQNVWYLDIQNSTVLAKQLTQNTPLHYNIAEFDIQDFYPAPPAKLQVNKSVVEVSNNIVDLQTANVYLTAKTPVDIKIYDVNNSLKRALTTDVNKAGKQINGIYWEVDGVQSIDVYNGRAHINYSGQAGDRILASFFYKTTGYTYTGWNFNPVFNAAALNTRVIILCKPDITNYSSSLLHITMDEAGELVASSDTEVQTWINTGTKTIDDLRTDWLYVPDEYEGNLNNYFMLGIVSVHLPVAPEHVNIFDARRRGGGLIDSTKDVAINLMPGAKNNWDLGYYDGEPVPLHGGIMVFLPTKLSETMTEDEIRARASQFAAAGSHIIIRYY